jgi:hypothetical protein
MTSVYVFGVILAVLLAAVLISPFLERGEAVGSGSAPSDRLDLALDALREIEFEHETDKLSDEDYQLLRSRYAKDAIAARDAGAGADADAVPADAGTCLVCEANLKAESRFCTRCGTEVVG